MLRSLTTADVPALAAWTPSKTLYRYWGKGAGKTDKDPSLLFAKQERRTKSFHWGIALADSDVVIGEFWVYLIENDRMAKLALRVSEQYHNQGVGTEVLRAVVRFCFTQTELKRLWTDVDVRNVGSSRVLEKCGFVREGLIRQGKMVSTWCDYYIYGLLRDEYAGDVSH